jgi:hypothetical protein
MTELEGLVAGHQKCCSKSRSFVSKNKTTLESASRHAENGYMRNPLNQNLALCSHCCPNKNLQRRR